MLDIDNMFYQRCQAKRWLKFVEYIISHQYKVQINSII